MKTRTISLFVIVSIVAILLSACSGSASATVSANSDLSTATRLAVGTIKLEGTDNAVTTNEAGELLTLWEAYQSLSSSDTASQVELEALVKQVEGTMTSEQLGAIDTMQLTDQSVSEAVESLAGSVDISIPASTPDTSAISQAAPQAGGPGGMPGGAGGDSVMNEINSGMSAQSTPAVTEVTSNTANLQDNQMLLNALIQLLKTRSQVSG